MSTQTGTRPALRIRAAAVRLPEQHTRRTRVSARLPCRCPLRPLPDAMLLLPHASPALGGPAEAPAWGGEESHAVYATGRGARGTQGKGARFRGRLPRPRSAQRDMRAAAPMCDALASQAAPRDARARALAVMASLCCLALSSSVCFLRSSLISCSRNAGVSGSPAAAGAPSCAVPFASCGSSPATKRHAGHKPRARRVSTWCVHSTKGGHGRPRARAPTSQHGLLGTLALGLLGVLGLAARARAPPPPLAIGRALALFVRRHPLPSGCGAALPPENVGSKNPAKKMASRRLPSPFW